MIFSFIEILIVIIPLLLSIAYLTLAERKILAYQQRRNGPNVVGPYGVGQPLADGLKLFLKEIIYLPHSNKLIFVIAPIFSLSLSLIIWSVIPFGSGIALTDTNLGILLIFSISSLSVYSVIFAGWSANSKYAFYGAIRATAQMVAYELVLSLLVLLVVLLSGPFGTLNLSAIIESQKMIWFIIPLFPIFLMFFITALAETARAPMDLTECEGELVSGYQTEHSAFIFAAFFIAEYGSIIFIATFSVILFLGGHAFATPWTPLFWFPGFILGFKTLIILFLFIAVRAAYPRLKYTQLIAFNWKVLLPISLGLFSAILGLILCF